MLIDYLYLILIIILISSIIFLIYLSYEYRINNDTKKSNISTNIIEGFSLSSNLNPIQPVTWDVNNQAYNIDSDYKNFITNIYNREIIKDNITNLDTLDKTTRNLNASKHIYNLQNKIIPQTDTFPIDKVISTIKSKYNSQYLSTFVNDISHYGILANDKCITVNGLCKDEYCLLDCQNNLFTSDSQKFTTNRINSVNDAARVMNVDVSLITSKNVYPYNIFRSIINNNCLTIGDDGFTIEKCNLNNIKQQWEISPDENICVLK